jgi:hypothetical protein
MPADLLLVLSVCVAAFACASFFVWRRKGDALAFKLLLTVVALVPILGPFMVLWVLSFPDRMHTSLQAKFPKVVNTYTLPRELPSKSESPSQRIHRRRRSLHRRGGDAT